MDLLVVGAGVVGLSVAKHAAQRGARVVVLDADTPGGSGSRAAAGVAIPSFRLFDDPEMMAFALAGKTVLAEELESLQDGALRRGAGIIRLAPDSATRDAMEAKAQAAPGWLGRWASAEELVSLEPVLQGGQLHGGFLHDDAYVVDTPTYLNGLLAQVAKAGVGVRTGEAALGVEEANGRVALRTNRETIKADRVVIAAGAWSGTLPGLRPLPVKPVRGQMLTVAHPTLRLQRVISGPSYLAPWRRGEIVVGATEEDAGFHCYPTPAGILHLSAVVARLAPQLREAHFVRAWAGLRSTVAGGRPLIGTYPGTSRVLIATGHAGQGILTGGLTGRSIAEILDHGSSEVAAPFDPASTAVQT
jgi:glycine oxidase